MNDSEAKKVITKSHIGIVRACGDLWDIINLPDEEADPKKSAFRAYAQLMHIVRDLVKLDDKL